MPGRSRPERETGGDRRPEAGAPDRAAPDDPVIETSGWRDSKRRIHHKRFPVPDAGGEPARVHVSAAAYSEIVSHAKTSLDAEVCGVLIGRFHEDDDGVWVGVQAAVRGASERRGETHVTYTQETWDQIHAVKDRDYPDLDIVGWYHSHPGFGVEFSEMDLFIQRNFFASPGQLALVTDPVGGDEAVCVNTPAGVEHLSRIWVEGRERICRLPKGRDRAAAPSADAAEGLEPLLRRLETIETRLSQVLQATEAQRASSHRVLVAVGFVIAVAVVTWIGSVVLNQFLGRSHPPELMGVRWVDTPMLVGDRPMRVGVGIWGWDLSREQFEAYLVDLEKRLRERLEEDAAGGADAAKADGADAAKADGADAAKADGADAAKAGGTDAAKGTAAEPAEATKEEK